MDLILNPGDIFFTRNPSAMGKEIRFIEALKAESGKSEYNHAGIIIDSKGTTFEALWHIENQNFFEEYKGDDVAVYRYVNMTPDAFQKGYAAVLPDKGMLYPWWRLGLHLVGLSGFIHGQEGVCSEEAYKFAIGAGAPMMAGTHWYGVNPQEMQTECAFSKYWTEVFKGNLTIN